MGCFSASSAIFSRVAPILPRHVEEQGAPEQEVKTPPEEEAGPEKEAEAEVEREAEDVVEREAAEPVREVTGADGSAAARCCCEVNRAEGSDADLAEISKWLKVPFFLPRPTRPDHSKLSQSHLYRRCLPSCANVVRESAEHIARWNGRWDCSRRHLLHGN